MINPQSSKGGRKIQFAWKSARPTIGFPSRTYTDKDDFINVVSGLQVFTHEPKA